MFLFTLFCFLWALTNDFTLHYLLFSAFPAPPLKLIDLPGIDQRVMDDSTISEYAGHNDAILIVVIPAMQAADVASSRALRLAKDIDPDGLSF
jgi:dynamin GTPase